MPLRILLLRADGSGKTQTIRTIVTILRYLIDLYSLNCSVTICAYTGVDATLMQMGAQLYVHYLK